MSLNLSVVYVKRYISHRTLPWHSSVLTVMSVLALDIFPGSARVSKELCPIQFSFEAAPLLSHIDDFLTISTLNPPFRFPDTLESLKA